MNSTTTNTLKYMTPTTMLHALLTVISLYLIIVLLIVLKEQEIDEEESSKQQGTFLCRRISRERNEEVVSISKELLEETTPSLLNDSNRIFSLRIFASVSIVNVESVVASSATVSYDFVNFVVVLVEDAELWNTETVVLSYVTQSLSWICCIFAREHTNHLETELTAATEDSSSSAMIRSLEANNLTVVHSVNSHIVRSCTSAAVSCQTVGVLSCH